MATVRPTGISAPNGDIWEFQDAKVGDITQTGVTGATVAAQISQLNDDLNGKCSIATYNWNMGSVTADTTYSLNNFKSTVGLSDKNIVAVGLVWVAGSADYDYGAAVIFRNTSNFARIKTTMTQSNTTACLYIIYMD